MNTAYNNIRTWTTHTIPPDRVPTIMQWQTICLYVWLPLGERRWQNVRTCSINRLQNDGYNIQYSITVHRTHSTLVPWHNCFCFPFDIGFIRRNNAAAKFNLRWWTGPSYTKWRWSIEQMDETYVRGWLVYGLAIPWHRSGKSILNFWRIQRVFFKYYLLLVWFGCVCYI